MCSMPEKPTDKNDLPPVRTDITDDDRLWATLAHLSILVGLSALGPLIIWLVKRESSPFIDDQAKEALNFQLSCLVASLVTAASCLLAPVAIAILIAGIVYGVIGGIEANRGNRYRYPYTFRMIN